MHHILDQWLPRPTNLPPHLLSTRVMLGIDLDKWGLVEGFCHVVTLGV